MYKSEINALADELLGKPMLAKVSCSLPDDFADLADAKQKSIVYSSLAPRI